MVEKVVSFEETDDQRMKAPIPEDRGHPHKTCSKVVTSTPLTDAQGKTEEHEDEDEDDDLHSNEDVEIIASTVPLPHTIQQRVHDIAKSLTCEQNMTEGIEHINAWYEVLSEEEADPLEVIRGQEETRDAYPNAFLVIDHNKVVYAIHSIGTANLRDRSISSHGRTYGFIGDAQ
jgi:hypothetical protein